MIFAGSFEVTVHHVKLTVAVGSTVKQGDEIGNFTSLVTCGCYDKTMSDHLHFKISTGGEGLDSSSWAFCQIK